MKITLKKLYSIDHHQQIKQCLLNNITRERDRKEEVHNGHIQHSRAIQQHKKSDIVLQNFRFLSSLAVYNYEKKMYENIQIRRGSEKFGSRLVCVKSTAEKNSKTLNQIHVD